MPVPHRPSRSLGFAASVAAAALLIGCHGGASYQGAVARAPAAPGYAFGEAAAAKGAALGPIAGATVSLCQCLEEKRCACDGSPGDRDRVLVSTQATTDPAGKFQVHLWRAVPLAGTLVYILAVRAPGFEPFVYKRAAAAEALDATEPVNGAVPITIQLRAASAEPTAAQPSQ